MNKRSLIKILRDKAKSQAWKGNNCSRILQAEDLTKKERRELEDWRLIHIAKETILLEIIEYLETGTIK